MAHQKYIFVDLTKNRYNFDSYGWMAIIVLSVVIFCLVV